MHTKIQNKFMQVNRFEGNDRDDSWSNIYLKLLV
jgi:hypothetical protein